MASENTVLHRQLREMENYIKSCDVKNKSVSEASVGWHLSHNLKVLNNVYDALEHSKPEDYRRKFSFIKSVVFLTGRIPRGKARAPKTVLPTEEINAETLRLQHQEAQRKINNFDALDTKANFAHPFFGSLRKRKTKRFLEIHTLHHLKIIRDILK